MQNSWGPDWGQDGSAVWLYEDWLANVMDGWVFRLALPTPQIFGFQARQAQVPGGAEEAEKQPPAPAVILQTPMWRITLCPSHHMGAGNHARLSHKRWTTAYPSNRTLASSRLSVCMAERR